ncbi:MAG TPA: TonB-dependent receptor [Thermoanaerobaculia bacterium]|nr:TonB-dependent receptor [Thermoanaerobaculia bacterium]
MRIARRVLLLGTFLAFAAVTAAQTTGSISGRVSDENGGALPGVAVEAHGAALQGRAQATTDSGGGYRLPLLPPGNYEISVALSGFAAANRATSVALGADTRIDFTMRPSAKEVVTVTAGTPVIDQTSTTIGANIDEHTIRTLPTDRNFASIAQVVPGVSTQTDPYNPTNDSTAITVYGSSKSENAYVIDGVDTSGVEYGTQGTTLNYEFIQEMEVKTGGYEAEYGRSTGGIINVITKSGGNEFHGDVFGYYDSDSLQANNAHVGESAQGASNGYKRADVGVDVGGFIVRDRLWFFGAYNRVDNTIKNVLTAGPSVGEEFDTKSIRNLAAGKLTYRIGEQGTLLASYFADPRVDTGAINDANHTLDGEPNTFLGRQDFGGPNYALRGDYLFGGSWLVQLQAARHEERNAIGPASAAGDVVEYVDQTNGSFQTGGFGLIQKKDFARNHFGAALTKYLGAHEIKGGLEYERETADVIKRMSGGQQVLIFANPNTASAQPLIYQHNYWTTPTASIADAPLSELNASPAHKMTTAYLQDTWNALPNLTVNLGVRWDRQQIIDSAGVQQIDLKKDYAPRFGFVWDPTRDHKTKVYGSFGRYYEEIPMDLVIRSYSYERQPHIYNYSPTDFHPDPNAEADLGKQSNIVGANIEPADPNLHGQYLREFVIGGEREVMPDFAIGVKYVYRNYGEVIEDFLSDPAAGVYSIGNPGEGIMKNVYDYNYDATPYPAQKPQRIFRGVEIDATKRFSNRWSMLASYLWSKLDGNYDGEFAPFTNVGADPNISAAYDYADFATNHFLDGTLASYSPITNGGPLSNDRRSQAKLSGTYTAPFGLNVGLSAYYQTGAPLSRMGFVDGYGRYELFLTKRGSEGRSPSIYEADLHLGYPLVLKPVTINLMADVFNLLNAQRPVLLDQRWDFQEADNSSPTPTNPNYKKAVLRQPPRSVRFGVRVSF